MSLNGPWEEVEESGVTNHEGARSRVQKAQGLTPSDPAAWENQPAQYGATWPTVLLSSPQSSFSRFSFPRQRLRNCKVSCQVEITHLQAETVTQNDVFGGCSWIMMLYNNTTVIMLPLFLSTDSLR